MKGRIVIGALLVSAVLASQGFGFELLDNLLGMNRGRTSACCEPQACDPACAPQACDPVCAPKNCCEPACQPNCCDPCCKPRCDLFAGLKGLFACKKCCDPCGTSCCEDVKCCTPEPACCDPQTCDPACCDPGCNTGCNTCCNSVCIPKCTPVRDLLEDILSLRIQICKAPKCCNTCCETACCEPNCCDEVGYSCNGGTVAPSTRTPKTAPAEKPAPLPDAPAVDPSASLRPNRYYKASRSIVRN